MHSVNLCSQLRLNLLKIFNSLVQRLIQTHEVLDLDFKLFLLSDHELLVLLLCVLLNLPLVLLKLLSKDLETVQCLVGASLLPLQILDEQLLVPLEIFNPLLQIVDLVPLLHLNHVFLLSRPFVLLALLLEPLHGLFEQILLLEQGAGQVLDLLEDGVPLVERLHAGRSQPVEPGAADVCLGALLASQEGEGGGEGGQFFDHAGALLFGVSPLLLLAQQLVVLVVDRLARDGARALLVRGFSEADALLV